MNMTSPMHPKPLVNATCKLGEKGCFADGRCHALGDCENKIVTNADRIRAMSDKELASLLATKFADLQAEANGLQMTETQLCVLQHTWFRAWMQWLQQPATEEA